MTDLLMIFWTVLNSLLALFVFHELTLMIAAAVGYKKTRNHLPPQTTDFPNVVIQLPVYNEQFVVRELINTVIAMDYPTEKMEVQILDDSTDETTQIIADHINQLKKTIDIHISHIRRDNRVGYKAGALAHGMTLNEAPFLAIFDADFRPKPDFLKQTLPHFEDAQIGVVQTRWGHINETDSILTRAQTVMLDAHFGIEQIGRTASGGFINFNGTAGIWRRSCIESAGGWHADTLTEDLDLSFRAQAKHWKIHFLSDVVSPAELPTTFGAFRNQQFRWSKGAAECFRKNIEMLWRSPVTFHAKLIGSFHLLNSSVYLLVLLLTSLAPLVFFVNETNSASVYYWMPYMGMSINIMLMLVFLGGKLICQGFNWRTIVWFLPSLYFFFSMSIGISLHMVMGVIEGYRGKRSPFVRTPKFGKKHNGTVQKKQTYQQKSRFNLKAAELILLFYGLFWLYIGISQASPFVITYSFILITGFSLALFFDQKTFKIKAPKITTEMLSSS